MVARLLASGLPLPTRTLHITTRMMVRRCVRAIEHELRGLRDLQQQLRHRDQMREACVETERLEWAEQRRVLEKRLAAAQKALAVEQRESAALRSQLRALCKSLRPPASYLQTAYPHSSSPSDASDVDAL
jgi:hypothetical protein